MKENKNSKYSFFLLKNFVKIQENFEMLNFSNIPDLLLKQKIKIPGRDFQVKAFGNIPGIWSLWLWANENLDFIF